MIHYKFKIEDLECEFVPLTAREGLQVSENFMSCMNVGTTTENTSIDVGKFSKTSIDLILSKLVVMHEGKRESVKDVDSLSLFFKNPLVSIEIVANFINYLTPFFHSLQGLSNTAKLQRSK